MLKENLVKLKLNGENIARIDLKDYLFECDKDNIYKKLKSFSYKQDVDIFLKDEGILSKLKWDNAKYLDCIFSFKTLFNVFMRFYLNNTEFKDNNLSVILENYDIIFSENEKNRFSADNNIDKELVDKLFKEIDTFAKNTNTLGNYMPCPDNRYNNIKGFDEGYKLFQDRLEKLYYFLYHGDEELTSFDEFKEKREKYKDWFKENSDKYMIKEIIDSKELLDIDWKIIKLSDNKVRIIMENEHDIYLYYKYLSMVNKIIEERGDKLAKLL